MRKPEVLHIVPALFNQEDGILGGAERYVYELARYMAREVPTRLVTFGERERTERDGDLSIRVIGNPYYVRGQRYNPFSPALINEVLAGRVIHCHQQHVFASSFSCLLGRITGKRVFATDLGGGGWDISGYISTDRWYHAHLHISRYSRDVYGHNGKPWAKVVYGGVDVDKFCPGTGTAGSGHVVFVGRILPHKGVNYLIEALPPDIPATIIGQAYHPEFFRLVEELAVGKHVVFRHDCSDAELVEAYRSALCVVLPSVYQTVYGAETRVPELLGQTLLEGMACGIPAICTDVASMPEIVSDGVNGFVVSPNNPSALRDKIVRLHNHPEEAQTLGAAARRTVLDKFVWPKVVANCLECYGIR